MWELSTKFYIWFEEELEKVSSVLSGASPSGTLDTFFLYVEVLGNSEYLYNFMLLLCPGANLASGSKYTLALLTAVGASPNPTAMSLTLPG